MIIATIQQELGEEQIKHLEVQFHSASYSKMMQVETGLKTTADHLIKVLLFHFDVLIAPYFTPFLFVHTI